jgi:hypothetical protein
MANLYYKAWHMNMGGSYRAHELIGEREWNVEASNQDFAWIWRQLKQCIQKRCNSK